MVSKITPYDTGYGFMVSNTGLFVSHPRSDLQGKNIQGFGGTDSLMTAIANGREHTMYKEAITDVNAMIDNVAASVEEQSATTREISENVSQAATGIQEVTENVTQSAEVAGQIARDISEVSGSAEEMADAGSKIKTSTDDLKGLSDTLTTTVNQFKVSCRFEPLF